MIKLLGDRLTLRLCSCALRALIKLNLKYINQNYIISKLSSAVGHTGHQLVKPRVTGASIKFQSHN